MATYYNGDLDADLQRLETHPTYQHYAELLERIGKEIGYGRSQQILQVLWARYLRDMGLPTSGALGTCGD